MKHSQLQRAAKLTCPLLFLQFVELYTEPFGSKHTKSRCV